jgi:hypothetical protein
MRRLLLSMAAAVLLAQSQTTPQTAPPSAPQTPQTPAPAQTPPVQTPPAQTAPAQAAPAEPAPQSPIPEGETTLTGWVDAGYQWRTGVAGSFDTYRSFVNLGSGPKLLGTDLTLTDPKRRLFDAIHVRAYGWGGDPYSTLHVDARKLKAYDFRADYRDIAYFEYLPSYADPLLARGLSLNEQSFDTRRRLANVELTMLPGKWISPYVAYDRDSGSGHGVSTFETNSNEFPVPTLLHDGTSNYRGGVHVELRRFHVTVEQGGTRFENDQTVYQSGGVNYGNSLAPIFGQNIYLTDMLGAYGARGTSIYTKGLLSASAASWLDFYGQFLYSDPNTNVNYQQYDGGNLYLQSQILFYTAEQYLVSSTARMPHTTGTAGAEIRPLRRLRLTTSWLTDRLHNAGSGAQNQTLGGQQGQEQLAALLESALATNYSQAEVQLFFEATSRLTLRGGYRYSWGDANDVVLPPEGLASSDRVKLRRNTGIGGFTYRPLKKVSVSAEGESASSGAAYFRTSLYNYQKVRAQARYQSGPFTVSADFNLLDNQDPEPGIKYDFLEHAESLSVMWSPAGGKRFDFQGSYTRADLRSDINYLDPSTLQPELSRYRDNSHTATALAHFFLPWFRKSPAGASAAQLTAGGSFVVSSGSRPASYYQPYARLWAPITQHLGWFGEWRYYGYGEAFYLYEGFRTHTGVVGVRYTR